MLPFLKQKPSVAGISIQIRPPDNKEEKTEEKQELEMHCKAILDAVKAQSPSALADAMKNAFECLESYPHEEGEHTNEEQGEY